MLSPVPEVLPNFRKLKTLSIYGHQGSPVAAFSFPFLFDFSSWVWGMGRDGRDGREVVRTALKAATADERSPQGPSSKVPSTSSHHWAPDLQDQWGCGGSTGNGGQTSKERWPLTALPGSEGHWGLGKAARQNMVRREADSSSTWCRALALLRISRTPSQLSTWGGGGAVTGAERSPPPKHSGSHELLVIRSFLCE